ncbi:hypothetical protein Tco_0612150 [Tanacetum coccineum]
MKNDIGYTSLKFCMTQASNNQEFQARKETEHVKDYILLLLWTVDPPFSQDLKIFHDDESKPSSDYGKKVDEDLRKDSECIDQEKEDNVNNHCLTEIRLQDNNGNSKASAQGKDGEESACARYQVNPKVSLLHAVKRIFRDSMKESDSTVENHIDKNVANLLTKAFDIKQKKSVRVMMGMLFGMELELMMVTQSTCIKDPIEDLQMRLSIRIWMNSLVSWPTTASSLEVEQDNGNINKTQSKKPWGILLLKLGLRMYLNILMIHCSQEVLDLEKDKELDSNKRLQLERKVKKHEKEDSQEHISLKRLYNMKKLPKLVFQNVDERMFDVNVLDVRSIFADRESSWSILKRVNTFEDFRTELVEGKEKRAGTELTQKIGKKQKVEDDKEIAELKQCLKIIPDKEEVTIDAIPLAVKSQTIVDWKIHKEGRKAIIKIIRVDRKVLKCNIWYLVHSLEFLTGEDLEDLLYKLEKLNMSTTQTMEGIYLYNGVD